MAMWCLGTFRITMIRILFPAIIAALDSINRERRKWFVIIARGGTWRNQRLKLYCALIVELRLKLRFLTQEVQDVKNVRKNTEEAKSCKMLNDLEINVIIKKI